MTQLMRGARPSPRYKLAAAKPHAIRGLTPPQWLWKPAQLNIWGNDVYGDCVPAEEAFAKACHNPEIFISVAEVEAWAAKNNVLNGADLAQVLSLMQTQGFAQGGSTYNDGPYTAVDWTNAAVLTNAIVQGPVKIGVAATQLQNAVQGDPPVSGWCATGFQTDPDMDHCVSLCGYGTVEWLWLSLNSMIKLPATIDPDAPAYAMFTWGSIGIIDVPSMIAITGEAWLRNPTTVIVQ